MRSAFCRLIGTTTGVYWYVERLLHPRQRSVVAGAVGDPDGSTTDRLGGDASETLGGEHASGADPRLVVVGDHRLTDDGELDRSAVVGDRPQRDPVVDLHPGFAHRQRPQGDLVVTRRLPTGGDHRPHRFDAVDRHERLDVHLTAIGSAPVDTGYARRGDHVRVGGDLRPQTSSCGSLAVVDDADDGVEVGAVADRVRRHVADRRRTGGDGDEHRHRHGDRADGGQDRHARTAADAAQGEQRPRADRGRARHADGDAERAT